MMIPGYFTVLLQLIMCILLVTGWKSVFAPSIRTGSFFLLILVITVLLLFPLWWMPLQDSPNVKIHAAVCFLLIVSTVIIWRGGQGGSRSYLLLCILMLTLILGSVKSLYSIEAMFHWYQSSWNAPLMGGLICGAFTSDCKHQFAIIAWGTALGEGIEAVFQEGIYQVTVGTLSFWDGFWLALSIAISFTLVIKLMRAGITRLNAIWLHLKGERSS
ncbi:hypothetical protein I6N90_09190 [Paenibacillus sp. GSMTC-2017]|uniref:YphA family membrane protein n=1 Tax=Paenibacillus sp. GSMTC-2017 TaxID=2794350 RepID=UPI0018D89D09|nr:hypothetical protein [Paenibacillus sp. GSMTC-2017]MBH5317978.1 hypothetical protein [Paenibacillus sp. GSMTC-2017]